MNFSKASNIFRYSLVFLLILTCITDIFTFFKSGLYEFEINPIVLFFKSSIGMNMAIIAAVAVKALMVGYITYWVATYKPTPKHTHLWAYLVVYMGILIIGIQIFGTYTNINTTIAYTADPVNVVPMAQSEAVQTLNIVNIIYYITTFLSLLSFWIYEKIFRKD